MTPEEQSRTGVSSLSPQQKMALQEWLNREFVLKHPREDGQGALTLVESLENGKMVTLSDGSTYEVEPKGRLFTSLWLTPVPIEVGISGDAEYPCKLTNQLSGTAVNARKVARP
jgi:DNA-binding transcriptional regulator PaaX